MSAGTALAAVLLVALLGACDAPARPEPATCPSTTITGTLEPLGSEALRLFAQDARHLEVDWPVGFSAISVRGRLSLVDPGGTVLAGVGDRVAVHGGEARPGTWVACGEPIVEAGVVN